MYDCINFRIMNSRIVYLTLALATAFSCRQPEITESALDPANLDRTVAPGDDFYQYATGGWQAAHP